MLNVLQTFLIGKVNRAEFVETVRSLSEQTDARVFSDCKKAVDVLLAESRRAVVDLIVLLQSYPNEFSADSLNQLQTLFPLTPFVLIAGSFSEGELRTGNPLSGVHRLYAYDWSNQGETELAAMIAGRFSIWNLPTTYAREEIYLELSKERPLPDPSEVETDFPLQGWVFTARNMSSNDAEMNRLFHAILRRKCGEVRFLDESEMTFWEEEHLGQGSDGAKQQSGRLFWDIGETDLEKVVAVLARLRLQLPHTTLTVFCSAPRLEERQRLQKMGADHVIAKPFDLGPLLR
ncbi:MAG: hypothetical protein ACRC10_09175 [Thermoguttaceae bacterium]